MSDRIEVVWRREKMTPAVAGPDEKLQLIGDMATALSTGVPLRKEPVARGEPSRSERYRQRQAPPARPIHGPDCSPDCPGRRDR